MSLSSTAVKIEKEEDPQDRAIRLAGMKQMWIIAGTNKGKGTTRVVDRKIVGTEYEMLVLEELLNGIARNPDSIPLLLQQLNTSKL